MLGFAFGLFEEFAEDGEVAEDGGLGHGDFVFLLAETADDDGVAGGDGDFGGGFAVDLLGEVFGAEGDGADVDVEGHVDFAVAEKGGGDAAFGGGGDVGFTDIWAAGLEADAFGKEEVDDASDLDDGFFAAGGDGAGVGKDGDFAVLLECAEVEVEFFGEFADAAEEGLADAAEGVEAAGEEVGDIVDVEAVGNGLVVGVRIGVFGVRVCEDAGGGEGFGSRW